MANVRGGITLQYNFQLRTAVGTNLSVDVPEGNTWPFDLPLSGTLLDQANLIHAKTYVLAASTPQTINLFDGSLTSLDGTAAAFRRVSALLYRVRSTNDAHVVLLGGAGANEWNGWLTVTGSKATAFPSTAANAGFSIASAPNTTGMVVATGSKLLKIDPGSNAVGNFDLVIVGRDA